MAGWRGLALRSPLQKKCHLQRVMHFAAVMWLRSLSDPLSPVSFLASVHWLLHLFPSSPPFLEASPKAAKLIYCTPLSECGCSLKIGFFFRERKECLWNKWLSDTKKLLIISYWSGIWPLSAAEVKNERPRGPAELLCGWFPFWSRSDETPRPAVAMVSDVIALPSDSFSGLNQVTDCVRLLRRPPQTDGNKFTPSFFILLVVNIHDISCCHGNSYLRPLSKPLF